MEINDRRANKPPNGTPEVDTELAIERPGSSGEGANFNEAEQYICEVGQSCLFEEWRKLQPQTWTDPAGVGLELQFPADGMIVCDCSHAGSVDAEVEHWAQSDEMLPQLQRMDPEQMRRFLSEYGAWDDEELTDDATNRERVLWIAACDIAAYGSEEAQQQQESA